MIGSSIMMTHHFLGIAVLVYVFDYKQSLTNVQLPMVWTTVEASLMSLMFLAVERTLAFRCPFALKSIVTVRRTVFVILCIWTFAATCGLLVYFYSNKAQLAMTILYQLCVATFLVGQAYVIIKMQQRKRQNVLCDHDVSMVTRKHILKQRVNNHVTKVVLILIIVVVVTLLPYMIAIQIYFLSALRLRPPLDQQALKVLVRFIVYWYPVELLNFIVNPIIYAYRLERYRRAFFNAFSFLNCGAFVPQRSGTYSGASKDGGSSYKQTQSHQMANKKTITR